MTSPAHFRQEAERYRKLAADESNPRLRDNLLGYARQYEALAALMEDDPVPPPPQGKPQRQPMQQQQQRQKQKKEDDE